MGGSDGIASAGGAGDTETLAADDDDGRTLSAESDASVPSDPGRVNRYVVLEQIGRGAHGRVVAAYDPDLDRRVALKLLSTHRDSAERSRLLDEAKVMARIDHPNVVAVYDAGSVDELVYVAMALIPGPSLDVWLKEAPRRPQEILDVFIAAGRGLQAAHDAGVVHRDFKPANVLVADGGIAKVGDFGLARHDSAADGDEGKALGTPAYMSPEHVRGEGVDARSDQFSFCVALAEAVLGERPFVADGLPALARKIVDGELSPRAANASGRLGRLLRRGLAAEPNARFASMAELLRELQRVRRPTASRWILGATAVAVSAFAWFQPSETAPACEPGAERIAAFWTPQRAASLELAAGEFTAGFSDAARVRLVNALDDYGGRWAQEYDHSCRTRSSRAADLTPNQLQVAECLENRLASMRGVVEHVEASPTGPEHVEALVRSLPDLPECRKGNWIPYPSDPEQAAELRELDTRLRQLTLRRLTESQWAALEEASRVVAGARALDHTYFLAQAVRELGLVKAEKNLVGADVDLAESCELALQDGHDLLAAEVINDQLILASRRGSSTTHALHLAGIALGLAARHEDWKLAGNVAMNRGNVLRMLGRFDESLDSHARATDFFERADYARGMVHARLNTLATLFEQGNNERALEMAPDLLREAEKLLGEHSRELVRTGNLFSYALAVEGRAEDALVVAKESLDRARSQYTPGSYTLHQAAMTHAVVALSMGHFEQAHASLDLAVSTKAKDEVRRAGLKGAILIGEGDLEAAARHVDEARARFQNRTSDHWVATLEVSRAYIDVLGGHPERAHEVLRGGRLWSPHAPQKMSAAIRIQAGFLGAASGAPDPEGTTWRDILDTEPTLRSGELLRDLGLAMLEGPPAAQRIEILRDELADVYFPDSTDIRVVDDWLSRARSLQASG